MDNFRLLWLAPDIDKNEKNFNQSLDRMRQVVNTIDFFTDADKCVEFLGRIQNEQVLLIVSGFLGKSVVPLVHKLTRVDSIYIYCADTRRHEGWTQSWSKVKGVFDEINSLCAELQRAVKRCEQDSVQISFVVFNETAGQSLDQLDPTFMYTQLFKEILLQADDEDDADAIEKLATYCSDLYAGNPFEIEKVIQFALEYRLHTPIWWYTYECFLYPMLNRSLRLFEVDLILKLGFFIRHLHQHIEQLHKDQSPQHPGPFNVYRGQGLSQASFQKLLRSKGGLLSFNNFLSTSKNRKVSLNFTHIAGKGVDTVGVLFAMTIDPTTSSTPFASLNDVSYYKDTEEEILFSMNTVFRVGEIESFDDTNRIWQVQLTLTADNDPQLDRLMTSLRAETRGNTGWQRLGSLLTKVGHTKKAEEIYLVLLDKPVEEILKGYYYHQLGGIKYRQGEYRAAVSYFEISIEIWQRLLPPLDPHLAASYNSIGGAYYSMGDHSKALSFYEQAMEIREQSLPPNDLSLTTTYNNIAILYSQMGEYSKAAIFYEKALAIEKAVLPPNHPDLATSYHNVGGLYNDMNDYSKALSFFLTALHIRERALPADHPDISESYSNVGSAYLSLGDVSKALASHEKALAMHEKSLSENHPNLATSHSNTGLVYDTMGEYQKALASHQKALAIREKVLLATHPMMATSHNNIGVVYFKMGDASKAAHHFERAVEIAQLSLPPNHPNLQLFRKSLESARMQLGCV